MILRLNLYLTKYIQHGYRAYKAALSQGWKDAVKDANKNKLDNNSQPFVNSTREFIRKKFDDEFLKIHSLSQLKNTSTMDSKGIEEIKKKFGKDICFSKEELYSKINSLAIYPQGAWTGVPNYNEAEQYQTKEISYLSYKASSVNGSIYEDYRIVTITVPIVLFKDLGYSVYKADLKTKDKGEGGKSLKELVKQYEETGSAEDLQALTNEIDSANDAAVAESNAQAQSDLDSLQEFARRSIVIGSVTPGEQRDNYNFKNVLTETDFYSDISELADGDAAKVEETAGKVVAVITNIGIVLSIIIPAVLGVKYMIGSAEEKAEYKKDMVPYLVGAVLLFGICTFVKILQLMGQNINKI